MSYKNSPVLDKKDDFVILSRCRGDKELARATSLNL